MRWLALIGVVGSVACTRLNPSYGDGGAEGGGTDKGDDPSGEDEDASVSVGEDEASADEESSIETGQSEQGETGASRPCCFAHPDRGCDDGGVEACVCTSTPSCCEIEWIDTCVAKARELCAAECLSTEEGHLETTDANEETSTSDDASGSSTTENAAPATSDEEGTGGASSCCSPHGDPLCNDAEIEECVCFVDGFDVCCADEWSQTCVEAALQCGARCA